MLGAFSWLNLLAYTVEFLRTDLKLWANVSRSDILKTFTVNTRIGGNAGPRGTINAIVLTSV